MPRKKSSTRKKTSKQGRSSEKVIGEIKILEGNKEIEVIIKKGKVGARLKLFKT